MLLREILFGRRSEFPTLAKAAGFDFLLFPDDLDASMFTKMALKETVDVRVHRDIAYNPIGGIIVLSSDIKSIPEFYAEWGSVGRFFKGRDLLHGGSIFDETSLGVEAIGFTTGILMTFSTILASDFHQKAVLVKDYSSNRIYLVEKHPVSIADLLKTVFIV